MSEPPPLPCPPPPSCCVTLLVVVDPAIAPTQNQFQREQILFICFCSGTRRVESDEWRHCARARKPQRRPHARTRAATPAARPARGAELLMLKGGAEVTLRDSPGPFQGVGRARAPTHSCGRATPDPGTRAGGAVNAPRRVPPRQESPTVSGGSLGKQRVLCPLDDTVITPSHKNTVRLWET